MNQHGLHIGLFGLFLLLGLSASPTARAAGAEYFVGLIPGEELADHELDQYSGRGVGLLGGTTDTESMNVTEGFRERILEALKKAHAKAQLHRQRGSQAAEGEQFFQNGHDRNDTLRDIRARIDAFKARLRSR